MSHPFGRVRQLREPLAPSHEFLLRVLQLIALGCAPRTPDPREVVRGGWLQLQLVHFARQQK